MTNETYDGHYLSVMAKAVARFIYLADSQARVLDCETHLVASSRIFRRPASSGGYDRGTPTARVDADGGATVTHCLLEAAKNYED